MPCYYPITIKEENSLLSNKGKGLGRTVPCGTCLGCLTTRRNQWTFRLMEEQKKALMATFTTLTYNDENVPLVNPKINSPGHRAYKTNLMFDKAQVQRFIKRVRKRNPYKVSYYLTSEYGEISGRPHYHAIFFNTLKDVLVEEWKDKEGKELGFVRNDPCNQATIHYVTKYIINKRQNYEEQKLQQNRNRQQFNLISKGLGKSYISDAGKYHINKQASEVFYPGGIRQSMPRYYKEKIFSEHDRRTIANRDRERANKDGEKQGWYRWQARKKRREIIAINNSKSKKL